jgi:signal transduction histidine kinase
MDAPQQPPGGVRPPASEYDRLLYSVSHDLRGPIHTILGFVDIMQSDLASGVTEGLPEDLLRIRAAAGELQARLDVLLLLSRLGRDRAVPVPCALDALAGEACSRLDPIIRARGASVEIQPSMPVVEAERERLIEVFHQLLDNALKFTLDQRPPEIRIGVAQRDGETVVFVEDKGRGVEAGQQERVFDLFRRLDLSVPGQGVGLCIARRIVSLHGGRLWLESPGQGKGSVFLFSLPPRQLP